MERGVALLQERHQHVAQDVLHAHAPRLWPHLLEDIHHAGRGERDAILPHVAPRIVPVRLARIGGVQIDDVAPPRRRNACRDRANVAAPFSVAFTCASRVVTLGNCLIEKCLSQNVSRYGISLTEALRFQCPLDAEVTSKWCMRPLLLSTNAAPLPPPGVRK